VLPLTQSQLTMHGHALEVRIYAEDPERGFLPSSGPLVYLREPHPQPGLRIDSGVSEGDVVVPHYDPMIAKLIVHADKREIALAQLHTALGEFAIAGVSTNLGFLARLTAHPDIAKGQVDTGFIARNEAELLAPAGPPPVEALALLGLAEFLANQRCDSQVWSSLNGFRLHGTASHTLNFIDAEQTSHEVTVFSHGKDFKVEAGGCSFAASAQLMQDCIDARLDGHAFRARLAQHNKRRWLFWNGCSCALSLASSWAPNAQSANGETRIAAPMPGRIVSLLIQAGKTVATGTPLLILEAMKMEHTIAAPANGQVHDYRYQEGDTVEEGAVLFDFEPKSS
jgi:3-methylcrotonyl-CoA carboxylase alpha subunit